MTPAEFMSRWRARMATPEQTLRTEIARHNAEVDRKKAEKQQRKAARRLQNGQKVSP